MAAVKNQKKTKDFESALARLEEIAAELENGDLPLEKSLDRFSEGIELARFCHSALEAARGRVELLLGGDKNGPLSAQAFVVRDPADEGASPFDDAAPGPDDTLPF